MVALTLDEFEEQPLGPGLRIDLKELPARIRATSVSGRPKRAATSSK
jgi:hypothetical protein